MYTLNANPYRVAPWEHRNTTEFFLQLARQNRLNECEPTAVFKMHSHYKYKLRWDYVVLDGHNKREAAYRAMTEFPKKGIVLPIIVIEKPADFAFLPDYKQSEDVDMSSTDFQELVREYSERAIEFSQPTRQRLSNEDLSLTALLEEFGL